MPSAATGSRVRESRLVLPGIGLLFMAGCIEAGQDFSMQNSSPATLAAGSSVEVTIDVICNTNENVPTSWGDTSDGQNDGGVLVPGSIGIACSALDADGDYRGSGSMTFWAVDDAALGAHNYVLRGAMVDEFESTPIVMNVVAPASPGFAIAVPPQATLTTGAGHVDIPITVTRTGHTSAIALSWEPLVTVISTGEGDEGGVRVVDQVPDGATTATVRVDGPGVAGLIRDGSITSVLVRAHGGTTDRAVIVQLLTTDAPPATPAAFTATPTSTSVQLSWTAAAGVLTYRLERQTSGGSWELITDNLSGNSSGYTDINRTPDTEYGYRVSATNVNGTSAFATVTTRTLPAGGPSGWVQLGTSLTVGNEVEPDPSLVLDAGGRPVVAYRLRLPGDVARIIVKRYDGGTWTQLGGVVNTNPNEGFTPSLAIDNTGTPYVAWSEYTGVSQRLYASRFNGTSWESAAPGGQPVDALGAAAAQPSLVIPVGGNPILAWTQGGTVQVRTLIGGQWVQPAGGSGFTTTTAYDVRLGLALGVPVLAWVEGVGATNAIKVARGAPTAGGFTFVQSGGAASLPLPAGKPSILLFDVVPADNGQDYVIYVEGETGFSIHARQFNGTTWGPFRAPIIDNNPNQVIGLGVDAQQLAVAWSFRFNNQPSGSYFGVSYPSTASWGELTTNVGDNWLAAPIGLSVGMATTLSPIVASGVQVGEDYELRVRQYLQP